MGPAADILKKLGPITLRSVLRIVWKLPAAGAGFDDRAADCTQISTAFMIDWRPPEINDMLISVSVSGPRGGLLVDGMEGLGDGHCRTGHGIVAGDMFVATCTMINLTKSVIC